MTGKSDAWSFAGDLFGGNDTVESLLEDMVKDIASEHVIYVPDSKKDEFGARLRDIRDYYAERIRKAAEHGKD